MQSLHVVDPIANYETNAGTIRSRCATRSKKNERSGCNNDKTRMEKSRELHGVLLFFNFFFLVLDSRLLIL